MTRTLTLLFLLFIGVAHANIVFTITHEHCGNAGGWIATLVTGGVPPYTYSWNDGPTTQARYDLVAGSYTLTVTDFLGAQQQNTAVVQNLPNWEWDPANMFAQAIPSCLPGPEPNGMGYVFFGDAYYTLPGGPAPHQFDQPCTEQPFFNGTIPGDWTWFAGDFGIVRTLCDFGLAGTTYAVNYTDANGCPGYMEAEVPQPPQFYPVTVLDIEGSCSGGANGRARFSIPPEPDYIYGVRPHLFNPDGQENATFWNSLATNWTGGWTYDVPDLGPGTHMLVRRLSIDPMFANIFPCGDTTYITIPDLGPTCGHVSGSVVIDVDENCVLGSNDVRIPEMILEFQPGPFYITTDQQGNYGINLPLGTYTVTQQTTVVDEHCLGDPIQLDVPGNTTFHLLDTALTPLDVQVSMVSGPARPGFELHYAIDLDNLTSATSSSNSLVMTFDANVSYLGATPAPSNVSGNTITWNNLGALAYFGHRDVYVRFQVPPNVGLIDTDLQASATLTAAGDANTANNNLTTVTTVTGSYDPNDKTAATSSGWSRDLYFIDVDQWIDYTIRFQNTGNDTAFTVVVTDTLPANLDPLSITMGAASHPFTWELQGHGTLKLYFVNILLPDSNVNEAASHGFATFRIRPRLPVLPGEEISNTANIFFDFNDPVITEPSVLAAEFSTYVQGHGQRARLQIQPNPAHDQVMIRLGDGPIQRVRILSMDGRELVAFTTHSAPVVLDIQALATGVYLIDVESNGRRLRNQLVKY